MDAQPQGTNEQLIARIEALEKRVEIFERMRVDEASGGGQLVVSAEGAVIRINGLTQSGGQLP
jgi:hypothetical protein